MEVSDINYFEEQLKAQYEIMANENKKLSKKLIAIKNYCEPKILMNGTAHYIMKIIEEE